MKKVLVLGGGGFIGGHLAKRLKNEGCWVRVVDIKPKHEYWDLDDICNDYISCDEISPLANDADVVLLKLVLYGNFNLHTLPVTLFSNAIPEFNL